ncbi:hypothetical protein GXB78_23505 [Pseudomonas moraviensis subsp. stanleyae]|uniref:hypothetical protein n=1 Tax=Pseudomonas moraviensis TaxID=321662 RepID=UPI002E351908|nr:hypothetical protein [Pseudomonas moraviensis]MED7670177.1 hypothetical protein [Pseudomonas moraviensis subsp. stanleyae]
MPYASENCISTGPLEGGIEITEEQYQSVIDSLARGEFLYVSIEGGIFSTRPAPPPIPDQTDEERTIAEQQIKVGTEEAWRGKEIAFISDQLIAMEDGDPLALPGTEQQWREYRTAVRGWKSGAAGFPEESSRPARPA